MSAVRTLSGTIRIGTSLTSPISTLTTASISLISGSVRFVGNVTGTIPGTSSQATNALTASYVLNAISSSFAQNAISSSYPISATGTTIVSVLPGGGSSGNNNSIFLGASAGSGVTSAYNSNFLGYLAGQSATFASQANFIGAGAGLEATRAENSNFFGLFAGQKAVSASFSTLIGWQAGANPDGTATIGTNNIILGNNITLPANTRNSINIGAILFATGSYSSLAGNPYSGSQFNIGRVGINKVLPAYTLDVSGSGNYSNGLTVTGSMIATSFTGSLQGTGSWSINSLTASYALNAISSSFASSIGTLNQNVTVNGNLTVTGTASFTYTTASQVDIGNNIILLNSDNAARFAGISVFDSGSTASTASLFWDSDKHKWIYQTIEGIGYSGGMLISGPRNTGSLGDEQGTTNNALMKGQGGDHITSSAITENGTSTTFYSGTSINATSVTSSTFLGNLTGTASVATTAADSQLLDGLDSAQFAQLAAQNLYTETNTFRNVTYYQADSYNVVQTAIVPTLGTNGDTIDVFNIYSFIEYNELDETRNYSAIFTYNILDISSGKTVRGGQVIMVWSPDRDEFKTLVDTNAVVYGGDITFDIIDDYTLGSEYVKLTMTNNSGGNVYVRGLLTIT